MNSPLSKDTASKYFGVHTSSAPLSLSMKVRHFFDPLVLEKFFDGKLRFDEYFQNVEVGVKKNFQKFSGPFSPVELAHWEKGY